MSYIINSTAIPPKTTHIVVQAMMPFLLVAVLMVIPSLYSCEYNKTPVTMFKLAISEHTSSVTPCLSILENN